MAKYRIEWRYASIRSWISTGEGFYFLRSAAKAIAKRASKNNRLQKWRVIRNRDGAIMLQTVRYKRKENT